MGAGPFPPRLHAVLNFRQKLGLDPNPLVCDPLGVGLRLTNEGLQSFLQVGGRDLVEVMINLACVDQIVAVATTDVDPRRVASTDAQTSSAPIST
jgi:hypothetical protein